MHLQRRQESLAIQILGIGQQGSTSSNIVRMNVRLSLSLSLEILRACVLFLFVSESWIPQATRQSCHIPGGYDCIALSLATFPRQSFANHYTSTTTVIPRVYSFLFCNQSDPHRFPQERNNRREWIVTSWMYYKRVTNFWLKNMFSHQQQLFYIHRWRLAVC